MAELVTLALVTLAAIVVVTLATLGGLHMWQRHQLALIGIRPAVHVDTSAIEAELAAVGERVAVLERAAVNAAAKKRRA